MPKVMLDIHSPGKKPTLQEIQTKYKLHNDEIDPVFNVVQTDPAEPLYTILVEKSAVSKISSQDSVQIEGPFSNPKISTFGMSPKK